ncbi:acyltransferase family protein [Amycolatopsis arida]|uniref:acyltransferase family protein n=1 Tax=Amycolatopsis arida TaxID=587909 RepID=UPI001FBBCC03|nr:hypothetical protein [Amycolatopsis arida]
MNGSLWTLPMEFVGYALVLAVGLVLALGVSRFIVFPLIGVAFVLDSFCQATFGYAGNAGSWLSVPIGSLVSFVVPFLLGMAMRLYRGWLPLRPWVAGLLAVAWVPLHLTVADRYVLAVMASYGAIVLAHHWPERLYPGARWVYGSYGMYIWAFPVQQLIIMAGVRNEWVLIALALPAAYLCGLVSWRFVEVPTQRLRRFLRRPSPVPARTTATRPPISSGVT